MRLKQTVQPFVEAIWVSHFKPVNVAMELILWTAVNKIEFSVDAFIKSGGSLSISLSVDASG